MNSINTDLKKKFSIPIIYTFILCLFSVQINISILQIPDDGFLYQNMSKYKKKKKMLKILLDLGAMLHICMYKMIFN